MLTADQFLNFYELIKNQQRKQYVKPRSLKFLEINVCCVSVYKDVVANPLVEEVVVSVALVVIVVVVVYIAALEVEVIAVLYIYSSYM